MQIVRAYKKNNNKQMTGDALTRKDKATKDINIVIIIIIVVIIGEGLHARYPARMI